MTMPTFFPEIIRCKNYEKKPCGSYYGYSRYHDQISLDCLHRCVYCDILITEAGGEDCALDHFRPQEKFPGLKNDPNNLVISCAKCNRLKSKHWPMPIDQAHTHDGNSGFIDPFVVKRQDYFQIEQSGEIVSLQPPSAYLIKLLNLNRPTRVSIRKKRILEARISKLLLLTDQVLAEVEPAFVANQASALDIEKFKVARQAISEIAEIRAMIAK